MIRVRDDKPAEYMKFILVNIQYSVLFTQPIRLILILLILETIRN